MPEAKFCECRKCENYYSHISVYDSKVTHHYCKVLSKLIEVSVYNVTRRTILCSSFKQSTSFIEKENL